MSTNSVISALELSASHEELIAKVNELIAAHNASQQPKASGKEMTDDDARRVLFGDLKSTKVKACAELLGLSYGQIYSCRGQYTFKHIHKEMKELEKKAAEAQS